MKKQLLAVLLLLLGGSTVWGHVIPYELDQVSAGRVFWDYLRIGFEHIIPLGTDHILFILCVFFLNSNLKQVLLQATMFTVAHSITLGLSMYGVIRPPLQLVEPLIAASILLLALENIWSGRLKPWRLLMVFLFGLVHGMGFAGALSELGMPERAFATALIAFNVGVEIGQLCIILALYLLVARIFGSKVWYRRRIVVPSSVAIAAVAVWWTVERVFFP